MSLANFLFGCAENLIVCDSADFDGTNDYMTRGSDLTNNADSKSGILSAWVRKDSEPASVLSIIRTASDGFSLTWPGTAIGTFNINGKNSSSATILGLSTSSEYHTSVWHHILASWDLNAAAGYLYIDDTSDLSTPTLTNDTIDYTQTNWAIGAKTDGTLKWDGCLAEVYFAPGQFLDLSVVTNRRKFISSGGKPVYLGSDGSLPTGVAPIVYQRVADAAAVATFATNLGTGGDFSITGTLTTGSTSPSD